MAIAEKKKSRGLFYAILVFMALLLFGLFKLFGPGTGKLPQGEFLYIHTGSDYQQVMTALDTGGFINDPFTFGLLAKCFKLQAHIHPGKYRIWAGMSNYRILRMLRSGRQTPVKLVINKLRTRQDFINLVASSLEADSMALKELLHNPDYLSQFGLDTNTALCAIMPDTYDFFWNTTADKTFRKIEKNYARFWDSSRKQQALHLGLPPAKVIILASIVDEETNINADKPNIASVYLNRLKKRMKLEADPTVKFAIGDFTIRRVTSAMLHTPSPYNTYANAGLPPGPICTPSISSIEAVLQAPDTRYLYFCAKDDFSGYSVFAATYNEQLKNAHAYRQALNERGIH